MENSTRVGFMAVFAVSGSIVLLAHQLHKRLLSNCMKKIRYQMNKRSEKNDVKKRVRFANDVMEPSCNNKEYRRRRWASQVEEKQSWSTMEDLSNHVNKEMEGGMPANRLALYRGKMSFHSRSSTS